MYLLIWSTKLWLYSNLYEQISFNTRNNGACVHFNYVLPVPLQIDDDDEFIMMLQKHILEDHWIKVCLHF